MYKIFRGFHLVETYQELKKAKRLAEKRIVSRGIKLAVAIMVSLVLWFLPVETFGVAGLTIIEQRLISIFAFATLMWIFEAIPAWTTSVLIVVLLLLTVSDSSLWIFTSCTVLLIQSSCFLLEGLFWLLPQPKADWIYCWHVVC